MDTKINRKVRCVEALLASVKTKTFPLYKIILFGSFSTGKFHERSDLDLCLVYEADKEPSHQDKVWIESYIDDIVGHEMNVDYVYAPLARLTDGCQVFDSIRKEGLVLWEHSGILH